MQESNVKIFVYFFVLSSCPLAVNFGTGRMRAALDEGVRLELSLHSGGAAGKLCTQTKSI